MLLAKNDAAHLTMALKCIQEFLEQNGANFPGLIMIDKCETERASVKAVGAEALLCEFHAHRLIAKRLKTESRDVSQASKIMKSVKEVQRATTHHQLTEKMSQLRIVCSPSCNNFYNYMEKWVQDWGVEWSDLGRKSRIGLFNTNNPSESFFKTLLRGFLKGITTFTPAEMLKVVLDDMIPVLNYKNQFNQSTSSNPNFKKMKKYFEEFQKMVDNNKIVQIDKFLFSVEHCAIIHKVVADPSDNRAACSCGGWLWSGNCLHSYSVLKLYEPNSGFFFESFSEDDTSELDAVNEQQDGEKLEEIADSINMVEPKSTSTKKIPSQRIRKTDLTSRKKNVRKGNHFSGQLKIAVLDDHSKKQQMPKKKEENAMKKDKSDYQQFKDISSGAPLGKRQQKKRIIADV